MKNISKQGETPIYKLSQEGARKVCFDLQAAEVAKLPAGIEDLSVSDANAYIKIGRITSIVIAFFLNVQVFNKSILIKYI